MKEGLLERIQKLGHWRVVIRPLEPLNAKLTLARCLDEVEKARVSLRGWDFPHISWKEDKHGGAERKQDYYENWCDWGPQREFWRMYRSGQFLSYSSLADDVEASSIAPPGHVLTVLEAVYSITEFVEFSYRLTKSQNFRAGVHLSISLKGTENRRLEAGHGRMPFFDPKRTHDSSITDERKLDRSQLEKSALDTGTSILLEFFDYFGWNPSADKIRSDQETLYRRSWP